MDNWRVNPMDKHPSSLTPVEYIKHGILQTLFHHGLLMIMIEFAIVVIHHLDKESFFSIQTHGWNHIEVNQPSLFSSGQFFDNYHIHSDSYEPQ